MKHKASVIKMSVNRDDEKRKAEINIEGEIGWAEYDGEKWNLNTSSNIRRQLNELMDADVDEITVNIHSLGGFVDDALAIHDALVMHPANVITRVTGYTASAATIIAQAGNTREISENAMYLVHEAWTFAIGTASNMLEVAEDLETINERIASIYAKRSGDDKEKYRGIMAERNGAGKWVPGEQAVDLGFADELVAMTPISNSIMLHDFGVNIPEIPKQEEHIETPAPGGVRDQYAKLRQREAELLTQI